MADLVIINGGSSAMGSQILSAIGQIRDGLAVLKKYEGMRAQTIGAGLPTFEATFGVVSGGQAFSDRLGALNGGVYTGLPDVLDATLTQVPGQ